MSEEKVTIFFCDDEENIRNLYLDILRELPGFNCQGFPCAESLLKEMDNQKVDLIISDMSMPGKTGYELAQELNQTKPQIPIVIVTGLPLNTGIVKKANKLANVKKIIHKSENFKPGTLIRRIFESLEKNDNMATKY